MTLHEYMQLHQYAKENCTDDQYDVINELIVLREITTTQQVDAKKAELGG